MTHGNVEWKVENKTKNEKDSLKKDRRALFFIRRILRISVQKVYKSCTWKCQMSSLEKVTIFHFAFFFVVRSSSVFSELIDMVLLQWTGPKNESPGWDFQKAMNTKTCCKSNIQLPAKRLHYRLLWFWDSSCDEKLNSLHMCAFFVVRITPESHQMRCLFRDFPASLWTASGSVIERDPLKIPFIIPENKGRRNNRNAK
jgi:hypothetical protein